ncbi:MAG TPA: hypothetical protein DDW49_07080 [Deltaproteobacteria bacterium]|nr:MAG: hypothetical protein A2048_10220 [Deltaproteobacteria bacterium GWA2_45_12]HBF13134.1 hypothetical protein [Deltaproteobacteria bacterium]
MRTKKEILIVDDDPALQSMLTKRLHANGYSCRLASSVEEALETFKKNRPDLVILDLAFQKTDGTAFLKYARDLDTEPNTPPVIVLSGVSNREVVDYVKYLGAKEFMTKPYESSELLSLVESHI